MPKLAVAFCITCTHFLNFKGHHVRTHARIHLPYMHRTGSVDVPAKSHQSGPSVRLANTPHNTLNQSHVDRQLPAAHRECPSIDEAHVAGEPAYPGQPKDAYHDESHPELHVVNCSPDPPLLGQARLPNPDCSATCLSRTAASPKTSLRLFELSIEFKAKLGQSLGRRLRGFRHWQARNGRSRGGCDSSSSVAEDDKSVVNTAVMRTYQNWSLAWEVGEVVDLSKLTSASYSAPSRSSIQTTDYIRHH